MAACILHLATFLQHNPIIYYVNEIRKKKCAGIFKEANCRKTKAYPMYTFSLAFSFHKLKKRLLVFVQTQLNFNQIYMLQKCHRLDGG